jgi:hypothetical protein
MNPTQLPLDFAAYTNNLLFTEHYLEHRVPELPAWDAALDDAADALVRMRKKRDELRPDTLNEAQLEEQWLQWIFTEILGHHYQVQVNLDYGGGQRGIPDYLFTTDAEAAATIGREKLRPDDLTSAVAIGDAKAWGTPFDKAPKGQRSPFQQIRQYLDYSELTWGILTDGRTWRLYERGTSKYNRYYAVDLQDLLDRNDPDLFRYFYLFFRREAFTDGWLDTVLRGSNTYAEDLRDSLEEQVFAALEEVAQGFLDYRRNRLDKPPSAETLALIYEESLVLLYRLLFIFYAESRDIMPVRSADYAPRSLLEIARTAETMAASPGRIGADDTQLYGRLQDLFFLIDAGDEELGVPAYNGKLFSDEVHTFLADKRVGDQYLAPAIDRLARVEVKRGGRTERVRVDYQDLEVSHLGTIYEKLLEYTLDYTDVPLVTSGKDETYKASLRDTCKNRT